MAAPVNIDVALRLQNLEKILSELKSKLGSFHIDPFKGASTKNAREIISFVRAINSSSPQMRRAALELDHLAISAGKLGAAFSRAAPGLNALARVMQTSSAQTKQLAREQQRLHTISEDLGRQTAITLRRFGGFLIARNLIFGLGFAFKQAVVDAIQFERELGKIAQLQETSITSARSLGKFIEGLAVQFGASSDKLVKSGQVLAQAGKSAGDVRAILAALAPASLTPTFGDLEKTTDSLVAVLGQFKLEAKDSAQVLDILNSVAKDFNVSVDELFEGIRRSGSTFAAFAGVDKGLKPGIEALKEFSALFTSVIDTSRESADVIGTAFRTILPRLQRQKTRDILKAVGVDLLDQKGQFVGPLEAINRLAEGLNKLGGAQTPAFTAIIEELGGLRQFNRVLPLITEITKQQQALAIANKSQGSVARDSALAQEFLATKIDKLKEKYKELIRDLVRTGTFENLANAFITLAKAASALVNALGPLLPILATIGGLRLTAGLFGFGRTFGKEFSRHVAAPGFAKGGLVSTLLTPGELVFNPEAVRREGASRLKKFNQSGDSAGIKSFKGVSLVPGVGNSDSVQKDLEPGSFIVQKGSVNKAFGFKKFAVGGLIAEHLQRAGATDLKLVAQLAQFGSKLVGLGVDINAVKLVFRQATAAGANFAQTLNFASRKFQLDSPSFPSSTRRGNLAVIPSSPGQIIGSTIHDPNPRQFSNRPTSQLLLTNQKLLTRNIIGAPPITNPQLLLPPPPGVGSRRFARDQDVLDVLENKPGSYIRAANSEQAERRAARILRKSGRNLSAEAQARILKQEAQFAPNVSNRIGVGNANINRLAREFESVGIPLAEKGRIRSAGRINEISDLAKLRQLFGGAPPGGPPRGPSRLGNLFRKTGRTLISASAAPLSARAAIGIGAVGVGAGFLGESLRTTAGSARGAAVGGALSGAGIGAQFGLLAGPAGVAVGALAGAAVSATSAFLAFEKAASDKKFITALDDASSALKSLEEKDLKDLKLADTNDEISSLLASARNKVAGSFTATERAGLGVRSLIDKTTGRSTVRDFIEQKRQEVAPELRDAAASLSRGLVNRFVRNEEIGKLGGRDEEGNIIQGDRLRSIIAGKLTDEQARLLSANSPRALTTNAARREFATGAIAQQTADALNAQRLAVDFAKLASASTDLIDSFARIDAALGFVKQDIADFGERAGDIVNRANLQTTVRTNLPRNLFGGSLKGIKENVIENDLGRIADQFGLGNNANFLNVVGGVRASRAIQNDLGGILSQATISPDAKTRGASLQDFLRDVVNSSQTSTPIRNLLQDSINSLGPTGEKKVGEITQEEISKVIAEFSEKLKGSTDILSNLTEAQKEQLQVTDQLINQRTQAELANKQRALTVEGLNDKATDVTRQILGLKPISADEAFRRVRGDVQLLTGNTGIVGNRIDTAALGVRLQELQKGGVTAGEATEAASLIKALELLAGDTRVLDATMEENNQLQSRQQGAESFIDRILGGGAAGRIESNQARFDLDILKRGGQLTGERTLGATRFASEVGAGLSDAGLKTFFGVGSQKELTDLVRRLKLGAFLQDVEPGQRGQVNKFLGESLLGTGAVDIAGRAKKAIDSQRDAENVLKRNTQDAINELNATIAEQQVAFLDSVQKAFNGEGITNFTNAANKLADSKITLGGEIPVMVSFNNIGGVLQGIDQDLRPFVRKIVQERIKVAFEQAGIAMANNA